MSSVFFRFETVFLAVVGGSGAAVVHNCTGGIVAPCFISNLAAVPPSVVIILKYIYKLISFRNF